MSLRYVIYIGEMVMPDCNAAAQRVTSVAKSIVEIGYTPVLLGLRNSFEKENVLNTKQQYYGMDCYSVKYPKTIFEWGVRVTTIKPIKTLVEYYGADNISAIIALDYESLPLLRLKYFCQRKDIRLIVDTVEWYGKSKLIFPINLIKDLDTVVRMRMLYPKIHYMICISNYLYYSYIHSSKNKVVIIPGTIDKSDTKWGICNIYKQNQIPVIGYVGHPGPNFSKERLDLLVRAIQELNVEGSPCRLKIAGISLSEFKKYANNYSALEYSDYIEFYGSLTHEDSIKLIASCDYTAIIRYDNRVTRAGFPTKLSESFGCGTPVITTPSSNITEFIIEGLNGYVTKDFSYDSIKKKIRFAVDSSRGRNLEDMHEYTRENNPLVYQNYIEDIRTIIEC